MFKIVKYFGGYASYVTDNRVMRDEALRFGIDNNGRDHPLYQKVTPHGDGLYHCPWEDQEECQHQPAKLKCEYE